MSRRSPGKRESLDSLTTREISLTRSYHNLSFNKMRNFAGLFKQVVCPIKQVASNIHIHVISFTNLNFIFGLKEYGRNNEVVL